MVGGSFHFLPMKQGAVGTAAICILMPFGAGAVLVCHMLATLSAPLLGAFLPRILISPGIVYGVIRAWGALLGMEATFFNLLIVLWVTLCTTGWVAAGWFAENPAFGGLAAVSEMLPTL